MRRELRPMLHLALPVIVAEIGWITMGIVDTIIVGPLGPAAIGAVGSGSMFFFAVIVLGMGTLYALDAFVAQNFGAGRIDECHRWLFAGLQLALVMSAVLVGLGLAGVALLPRAHVHPEVLVLLQPYLRALQWSAVPLMIYTVCRRYLQAMNVVAPVTIAVLAANVVNALGNWVFVYGKLGAPALGVVGSAYATLGARVFLAVALFGVILHRERRRPSGLHDVPFALDPARLWQLVRLGAPAAGQLLLEVGVFALASALAAQIGPLALAANQIVLNIAGFLFMIPLGLNSAAAVRVGHAVGRRDAAGARAAGWTALALTGAFAVVTSAVIAIVPEPFLRIFTTEPSVIDVGAALLLFYAVCQPFDGFQSVATGALRGLGETRAPMLANLIGHWAIGLPIGYLLCFSRGWGVVGLWAGLTFGLFLVGAVLLFVWHRKSDRGVSVSRTRA
jgi:MATE family, multidrug efflux pump